MRSIAPILVLSILSAATASAQLKDITKDPANKAVTVVIVTIIGEMGGGVGTGVVVDHRGLVLTNLHVVLEGLKARKEDEGVFVCAHGPLNLWLMDKRSEALARRLPGNMPCRKAALSGFTLVDDLALLKVPNPFAAQATLTAEEPEEGDFIFARTGIASMVAPAIVKGWFIARLDPDFFPKGDPRRIMPPMVLLDLSANPGGSGGPVFDGKGRVFSLIDAVSRDGGRPNTAAVPGTSIIPFVKANNPFPPLK